MRSMRITAAATLACAGVAQSVLGAITVTSSAPVSSGGFDRYDIMATVTGSDTGTQIKGLEFFYSGAGAAFQVDDSGDGLGGDPDGIPDSVNFLSATRTRVRVSTTAANNVFVGVTPNGSVQPNNPYLSPVTAFSGAIANTGTTQATGAGFQIARFFLPVGGYGIFSGNIGGDVGSKVPFSVGVGGPIKYGVYVQSIAPDPANILFGQIVSAGAPFSVTVEIGGAPPNANVFLTMGQLPSGVHDVAVTGGGTQSRTFVVSGIVDYSLNGSLVNVPFTGNCPGIFGPTTQGTIHLSVTPEPASIALIGVAICSTRRRR